MANDLTGDFDVVAEFAVLAVNRVLAAMHRCERFPHSMTLRVDDNPPAGSQVVRPSIVGSVDTFGDATVNHNHIGTRSDLLGQFSAADPRYWALDGVVNTDVVGANDPPVVPSKLQGRAQLQLAAPTIEVTDASGSNITVKLPVMARYFHDPHTPRVADFVRGELQITAPVDQVASPDPNNVRMIDIDIKADSVNINFDPKWSSQPVSVDQPLSAEDLAAVNLLIRNALKTSFLPSSNPLPSNINYMQFKTLLGAQSAIGVLLNLGDTKGNPASMNKVFLDAGDDFGFAVGSDFIVKKFREQLALQPPSGSFLSYTISVNSPTLELQNDQIVLSVTGHAHSSVLPDFGFTFTQAFTLNLAATIPGGPLDTAALAVLGDISHEVHGLSFVFNWIADDFIGWPSIPSGSSETVPFGCISRRWWTCLAQTRTSGDS